MVSWNVRGLGHVMKRAKVSHLKSLSADILFLQETHVKYTFKNTLEVSWIDQI